jgi:hypothetical protein
VGLRWWNEVNTATGESHWVFESASPETRTVNATDKRFFWLTMYLVPALWVGLAILAILRLIGVIWLVIVGMLQKASIMEGCDRRANHNCSAYSDCVDTDHYEHCCF